MTSRVIPVEPFDLVIFGATGDLAARKLLPALYHRERDGQLPEQASIIGCARTEMSNEGFVDLAKEAIAQFVPADRIDAQALLRFLERLSYVTLDVADSEGWSGNGDQLTQGRIPVFYLSVGPSLFGPIVDNLARHGLNTSARLVVEKPIGKDGDSAAQLNQRIANAFPESHVYRIDHYLGKETVQNLIALRFSNAFFEPLWNARHVDHIQITVAESVGIAGREAYYDRAGAMRDMMQNHLLQLLCLIAMEPPARFEPGGVRDEKLKVLRALRPLSGADAVAATVTGQYQGYQQEVNNPQSRTASFVAVNASVDSWRWAGVPFFLRTGKKLRSRMSEIVVQFKQTPHKIFTDHATQTAPNALVFRLQPDEAIDLMVNTKDPGPGGFRVRPSSLDMNFGEGKPDFRMPDAYERLVLDVVRGDQTLFMRADEVQAAWDWVDPIIAAWDDALVQPDIYEVGSDGPDSANALLQGGGRHWRDIEL
jgi:glucose-6-phosphate 1-dehydrogenase